MQLSELSHWKQELRPHLSALAAAFGALMGAGVFFYLPFDPWWGWGLFGVIGLLGYGIRAASSLAWWRAIMVFIFFMGLAFLLSAGQTGRVVGLDYAKAGKPHWLVGRVEEIVLKDEKPNRATLRLGDVETFGLGDAVLEKASVGVYRSQITGVALGDTLAMPVVLMAPEGPKYKGQRDGRVWRYFGDSRVGGYVLGTVESTWRPGAAVPVYVRVLEKVEALRTRIYEVTRGYADGTLAALLVGEEKGITTEMRDAYRNTGLAHLLAISGMQMTIVALGIFWVLRWLGALVPWMALRVNIRLWAAVAALVGTVFYTLLAGASVSLVRSSIMAGIVMIAMISGRMKHALRAWCTAAVLVVIINPVMVTRAGFQLSLAAVLALILLAIAEQGQWKGGKVSSWVRELVLATVVAGAATAPVAVAQFGQFSVVGMLANLVAVPVMSLATYIGMVALVVWPLGLEKPVLDVMALVVGWVNSWALWLDGFGLSSMIVDRSLWWISGVFGVVAVASVLLKRWVEAGVAVVSMTGIMVLVTLTTPKPEIIVWDGGNFGLVKQGEHYTLLWAESVAEAQRLAKLANVDMVVEGETPQTVDERYMPVTQQEFFAWAERTHGRWQVQPLACGRVWQRVTEGCWK